MSSIQGGLFSLLTNDGKQDKLLMATDLLNEKLSEYRYHEMKETGDPEAMPKMWQIELSHVFFMHAQFKPFVAIGYSYNKSMPSEGVYRLGAGVTFSIPQFGDFFSDMALHIVLKGLRATDSGDKVRYAQRLGCRLMERVTFKVNGNILDEVTYQDYANFDKFNVADSKRCGWNRCIGQEVCKVGYITQDPLAENRRECITYTDGPQTLKPSHDEVELWIPMIFWFNLDPAQAIPSVSIPFGQRNLIIKFADVASICDGVSYGGSGNYTIPQMTTCELYINNIFVNPEIHDIFIKKIGFSLMRVHRQFRKTLISNKGEILLNELKFPIESMYICFVPHSNLTDTTKVDHWHKCTAITETQVKVPAINDDPIPNQLVISWAIIEDSVQVIDKLGLKTNGVTIYDENTPASFYNSYTPFIREGSQWPGGPQLNTPEDSGAYFMPFNLYPGAYQANGHFNASRAREIYLHYQSSYISSDTPVELFVCANALNFLLLADGGTVLRYST